MLRLYDNSQAVGTLMGRPQEQAMQMRFWVVAALALSVSAPSVAADMNVRHHHHRHARGGEDVFLHNVGPPDFYPGTTVPPDRVVYPVTGAPYGIYDGFDRFCGQSSANYIGQDGRRHPCN